MKLDATTYTSKELEALAAAAADLNIDAVPNKEVIVCHYLHLSGETAVEDLVYADSLFPSWGIT